MNIREDCSYTRTHQWMREENGTALVGITDYAQSQLGGIVFINLPEAGDTVTAGEPFGEVESTKVVSEVHSPVSGTVRAVNEPLADEPERINEDPYEAWFIEVEDVTGTAELLTAQEYRAYLGQLAGEKPDGIG